MHMYHVSMLAGVKITLWYKSTVKINCQMCISDSLIGHQSFQSV